MRIAEPSSGKRARLARLTGYGAIAGALAAVLPRIEAT